MGLDIFSVPVFFITFRESLEVILIVAILLAFLKRTLDGPDQDPQMYNRLVRQVWWGVGLGFLITVVIAGSLTFILYQYGEDKWSGIEYYWEGSFALVASLIITVVGGALLRVSKMEAKWRLKLAETYEGSVMSTGTRQGAVTRFFEKYALFILPFVTVLREGIEAIVFIAGVSFSTPFISVPLPIVVGVSSGSAVGYLIYRGGTSASMQYFLVGSTCLLYLVAAGLFSKAVWFFEAQQWNNAIGGDAIEVGSGPGSYDITKSVWHVNYGNPYINAGGGWGIFNAVLGWQNSATYGSVISYNMYWIAVTTGFLLLRYKEVHGNWPLRKVSPVIEAAEEQSLLVDSDSFIGEEGSGLVRNGPDETTRLIRG